MKNFPAPPNLNSFDPVSFMDSRAKNLDTSQYSYKLADTGHYALDTIIDKNPEIDEQSYSARFPFSCGLVDGVGDKVNIAGIDCSRHRLNPICGWEHFRTVDKPIGIAETRESRVYTVELDIPNQVAYGTTYFYQGKGIPGLDKDKEYSHAVLVSQIWDLLCKRIVRGSSLGYQIKSASENPANYETGTPKGLNLHSVLLLEYSVVVTPANASTIIDAKSLGYKNPYLEWQENIAETLSRNNLGGKSIDKILVKSLSPYAPPKIAQLGYEGVKSMEEKNEKAMSSLNENTGGALVPPPANGPPIEDKKSKQKSLRKKYKGNYGIEGVSQPGYEAQREKEGIVTVPNAKWKPGRGAIKSHAFVDTSNAGITGNGLGGDLLKKEEHTDPYLTSVKPGNQKSKPKTGKKYGDSLPQDAPDEVWAHNSYDQRFKNLRKKYKGIKGTAGAIAGGIAGVEGGPAGVIAGANAGSTVEDAVNGKGLRGHSRYGIEQQSNGFWITDSKYPTGGGIGPFKTREEAEARIKQYEEKDKNKKSVKSAKAPGISDEPAHKSINVRWRNKVVKGFAEVQLRFDMMDIDIDKQNAFLVEMAKEGFGTPGQGKYVSKEPPKLAAPLKQATFTFTIEPMNRQSEDDAVSSAIRTATQIAKRHGCRYTGNIGKSLGLNYHKKSIEDSNMPEEMEEEKKDMEGGEGEEKYSAQVLRHMHENALILLEEYDSFVEQLEHPEIAKHLHSKLEALVGELDEIEGLMEEHHPESEPLGEGTKDMEGGDEGDSEETPVEADSEEEEVPDPDEVLEGMDTKSLRNHYIKALRKNIKSRSEPAGRAPKATPPDGFQPNKDDPYYKLGRGIGVEDGHMPGEEQRDNSGLKKGPKLGTTKKGIKGNPSKQSTGRGLGIEGESMPGHEEYDDSGLRKAPALATTKKCAACGHKDAPNGFNPDEDDPNYHRGENLGVEGSHTPGSEELDNSGIDVGRGLAPTTKGLKSHHMKAIEGAKAHLADASNEYNWDHEHRMKSYHWHKALEETGDDAFGGMDEKDFPVMDHNDVEANVTEPGEMGEKDYQNMPDDEHMSPVKREFEGNFEEAKSLHPHHKCMMGASKFLKDLSDTFDYNDDHRQEAAAHHMNLDGITKNFSEMDGVDGESEVQEPGEKSIKSLSKEELVKQSKEIAELKKLLKMS